MCRTTRSGSRGVHCALALKLYKTRNMRVQKPVGYFVRAVLLMPLYIPLFAPKASSSATAGSVYTIVLKVRPPSQVQ